MKVPFLDLNLQHKALREPALAALTATYDARAFASARTLRILRRPSQPRSATRARSR
jgi:hypothetical protein